MISLMRNHDLDQEQANVSNLCCPSVSLPNYAPNTLYTFIKKNKSDLVLAEMQLWMNCGSVFFFLFFLALGCSRNTCWSVWFFCPHFLKHWPSSLHLIWPCNSKWDQFKQFQVKRSTSVLKCTYSDGLLMTVGDIKMGAYVKKYKAFVIRRNQKKAWVL